MNTTQQYLFDKYGVTADTAKISDILFIAANEYLWDGIHKTNMDVDAYSCSAIMRSMFYLMGSYNQSTFQKSVIYSKRVSLFDGLTEMGLDCGLSDAFDEFKNYMDRQQARYAWLMFAHDIALEQGV